MEKTNLIGAITAVVFFASAILVFASRLLHCPRIGYWLGWLEILLILPLLYLLLKASGEHRPTLYYIQLIAILIWLVVELFLDSIPKLDFRHTRWMVITYLVLCFAGAGGLVGIASAAGPAWKIASIILFLVMAVLTFVQRAVTGM